MTDPKPKATRKRKAPEPVPVPEKPRSWVSQWMRSEAFWRDVTSQALGGFIVVLVAAIGTALSAFILDKENGPVIAEVALVVIRVLAFIGLLFVVLVFAVSFLNAFSRRYPKAKTWQILLAVLGTFAFVAFTAFTLWVIILLPK